MIKKKFPHIINVICYNFFEVFNFLKDMSVCFVNGSCYALISVRLSLLELIFVVRSIYFRM